MRWTFHQTTQAAIKNNNKKTLKNSLKNLLCVFLDADSLSRSLARRLFLVILFKENFLLTTSVTFQL
jgi:hypothetical protein